MSQTFAHNLTKKLFLINYHQSWLHGIRPQKIHTVNRMEEMCATEYRQTEGRRTHPKKRNRCHIMIRNDLSSKSCRHVPSQCSLRGIHTPEHLPF